jgi:hypothetical protein
MQAAILLARLELYSDEIVQRKEIRECSDLADFFYKKNFRV